jgi:hypothetical protein
MDGQEYTMCSRFRFLLVHLSKELEYLYYLKILQCNSFDHRQSEEGRSVILVFGDESLDVRHIYFEI